MPDQYEIVFSDRVQAEWDYPGIIVARGSRTPLFLINGFGPDTRDLARIAVDAINAQCKKDAELPA